MLQIVRRSSDWLFSLFTVSPGAKWRAVFGIFLIGCELMKNGWLARWILDIHYTSEKRAFWHGNKSRHFALSSSSWLPPFHLELGETCFEPRLGHMSLHRRRKKTYSLLQILSGMRFVLLSRILRCVFQRNEPLRTTSHLWAHQITMIHCFVCLETPSQKRLLLTRTSESGNFTSALRACLKASFLCVVRVQLNEKCEKISQKRWENSLFWSIFHRNRAKNNKEIPFLSSSWTN